MVFQEAIAAIDKRIPTLSVVRGSSNVKKDLEDSWEHIIDDINYEPVLDIALKILRNIPANDVVSKQLSNLVDLSYDIASSKVLLRHDLFGRIYHRLLLGKLVKYFATYYTSIPAARLLANLLVNLPSPLQADTVPPLYGKEPLRVVDFACGSGTLLSAIYKELDTKHRLDAEKLDLDGLHKYLIEKGIWGFDVLQHAVHLASTVLLLHDPVSVNNSNMYALRLGEGEYLGSVNFLQTNTLNPKMLLSGPDESRGVRRFGVSKEESKEVTLPKFHLCIMNPPFTRSVGGNLLFGSLPSKERKLLQVKLAQLLKEKNYSGIGQAGLGAVFVVLGDKYLNQGGRLGLVLPRAVLSGVAWKKIRGLLRQNYSLEYIITSYQRDNEWNFSENTSLSEVLLVARKAQSKEPQSTFFVNLWRKPTNEIESIHLGVQLAEADKAGNLHDIENSNASTLNLRLHGKKIGEAYTAKLDDNNFGAYNFFSQMELNRVAVLLRRGIMYTPEAGLLGKKIPLTTLSGLAGEVGPDRHQVHSVFEADDIKRGSTYKALWGFDSKSNNKIDQKPNKTLNPRSDKQARSLWERAGTLLIAERAWLATYPTLAVMTEEKVLSNVWWPVKIDNDYAKMLSVWLNSTFGLLLLFTVAEVTRGPWIDLKKEHVENMLVLNLKKIGGNRDDLLELYSKVRSDEFKSMPDEFKAPKTRRSIDEGIAEILGFDVDLDGIYRMLANEPMILG